jgi:APA family basic amino acid/polyamine antiporter
MAWVITGVLTITAALSYGELAALMPKAGGQYVYLREAYSPLWGFLYGWTLFMVIQTGTIAAVAVAFAKFLGVLVPQISAQNLFFDLGKISLGGFKLGLSLSTQQAVAIVVIALLTYSNSNGIRTGKLVQDVFTITKVGALVGLILLGLLIGRNDGAAIHTSEFWTPAVQGGSLMGAALLAAVCTSMVGSLFSSDAWNNITFTAGEVINPWRWEPAWLR